MSGATTANPLRNPDPPSPPPHSAHQGYRTALKRSFIGHAAFILFILIKSLVFPSKPAPFVPTLRVDMVGLPDVLKKDLKSAPPTQGMKEIAEALKRAEQDAKRIKPLKLPDPVEKTAPDELVLKPKATQDDAARSKRLKNAMDRIKALERIKGEAGDKPSRQEIVKGNQISKGTSLSGDAKEAAEASYYDHLRDRLQENWALPVWLARQDLQAQVQIFVDGRGRLREFRFVKTSGNTQFDSAIKKALEESQPFPIPPQEIAGSVLSDGVLVGFPL